MSTKAQITLKISKLSSSAIEKNIAAGKYAAQEELDSANEILTKRNEGKGKAEAEKKAITLKKAKPGKAPIKDVVDLTDETPEPAPKKEKKVKTGKIDAADIIPAEKPAKKEKVVKVKKPRKDGHGNIRAAIKELLLAFVSPAEVRKSIKESLKLTREVHYSEVKSVLDRLKADVSETGVEFTKQWDEKYAAAKAEKAAAKDATPKEKTAKKKKDTEVPIEPAEPTEEELAALAATEAENQEVPGTEEVA